MRETETRSGKGCTRLSSSCAALAGVDSWPTLSIWSFSGAGKTCAVRTDMKPCQYSSFGLDVRPEKVFQEPQQLPAG